MTVTVYELKPKFDSAKSFYGKAQVIDVGATVSLVSYGSRMVTFWLEKGEAVGTDPALLSGTTLRHVKEFLKQQGFKAETKAQIVTDYFGGRNAG